ncbi:MAG TPA: type II toxin-antitoxin system HicA family toxin [Fimbriimonadaceae bacterium]|nr:type II toxin-antitoxin system HicA family toxin [Fimbriimonadaceae bacterium]
MSEWPAVRAREVLKALQRIGWTVKRTTGSHRVLTRPNWPDFVFAFRDTEEIGSRMLSRISRHTGLSRSDLK